MGVGVGKCQSEDPSVYFGTKPAQRACARDLPRGETKTREGRSQSRTEKEAVDRSQGKPTVKRRKQNREVNRTRQSAGESR